jgi:hypothetical protein
MADEKDVHPNDEGKFSLGQMKVLRDRLGDELAEFFGKLHGVEEVPEPEDDAK